MPILTIYLVFLLAASTITQLYLLVLNGSFPRQLPISIHLD